MMKEQCCVICGVTDKDRPVWVFIEPVYGIGLCWDCSNGSNKKKFWAKKRELILAGVGVTNKPGCTLLTPEEIHPTLQKEKEKQEKHEKWLLEQAEKERISGKKEAQRKKREEKEAAKLARRKKREDRRQEKERILAEKKEERERIRQSRCRTIVLIGTSLRAGGKDTKINPSALRQAQDKAPLRIKEDIQKLNIKTMKEQKTKVIWVVSQSDPAAEDLASIRQFVEHFGNEDIDIRMSGMHVIVKQDEEQQTDKTIPSRSARRDVAPLRKKYDYGDKYKGKYKKFKYGSAVNNTKFPNSSRRQAKIRCTGCGTSVKAFKKGQKWIEKNEKLFIGLCSECNDDTAKVIEYNDTIAELNMGNKIPKQELGNQVPEELTGNQFRNDEFDPGNMPEVQDEIQNVDQSVIDEIDAELEKDPELVKE